MSGVSNAITLEPSHESEPFCGKVHCKVEFLFSFFFESNFPVKLKHEMRCEFFALFCLCIMMKKVCKILICLASSLALLSASTEVSTSSHEETSTFRGASKGTKILITSLIQRFIPRGGSRKSFPQNDITFETANVSTTYDANNETAEFFNEVQSEINHTSTENDTLIELKELDLNVTEIPELPVVKISVLDEVTEISQPVVSTREETEIQLTWTFIVSHPLFWAVTIFAVCFLQFFVLIVFCIPYWQKRNGEQ